MAAQMDYVDTHFHVYELDRFSYDWPTPDLKIYRNYYPCGLENATKNTPIKHGVFVQCINRSPEEAEWVMDMATRHPIIKGVVAGLDLTCKKLEESIERLLPSGLLKGARHILDVENDDWIKRGDVSNGLDTLAKYNLTFDLLVRPHHLKLVSGVISKHPNLKFIIDHIAKPPFQEGKLAGWNEDMAAIARYPNAYCKISGLISELSPTAWKTTNIQPFVDHVLSVFTVDRCMFGSDWPIFDLVGANYEENFNVVLKSLTSLGEIEKQKVFRENAIEFYNLHLDKQNA